MKVCPQCGTEYADDQLFCSRDGVTLRTVQGGQDLVGTIIADRYVVRSKLGEGGMGQVYLAEHVRMGRKSAVKVMRPNMLSDADSVARFVREATNASQIDHPNVAAIYDFGETADGLTYLAMEYVDGEPLSRILERDGAMAPARAASIVQQTAAALGAAHEMHIVHRDLKPDNIMVAKHRDGRDRVKVVDFGIAKVVTSQEQHVTMSGVLIGTPSYMSPEQVGGDRLDGRSDEYALALVAVKMLTGELPFAGETTYEIMTSRLAGQPRTLSEIRPEVAWPAELERVLARALAMAPSERYDTAVEFGHAFAQAIALIDASTVIGEPMPDARGSSPAERVSGVPPTRRRDGVAAAGASRGRRWMAAAGVAITLGLGAGGTLLWQRSHVAPAAQDSVRLAGQPMDSQTQTVAENQPARQPDSLPLSTTGTPDHAPITTTQLNRPLPQSPLPRQAAARDSAPPPTYSAFAGAASRERAGHPDTAHVPRDTAPERAEVTRLNVLARRTGNPLALRRAVDVSYAELPRMTTRRDSIGVLVARARALAALGQKPQACSAAHDAAGLADRMPNVLATITKATATFGCP